MNFEIVEGTYNFFKVNAKGYLSPCKLVFKQKNANSDMRVYYSMTNVRPEEGACERSIEDPTVFFVRAIDGKKFNR